MPGVDPGGPRRAPVSLGIVTPLFNGRRWIRETAESICTQLGGDDRYIIVDDGSTDAGADLVRNMHPRLEIVVQRNAGEAAAVNRGVEALDTDAIGVVNADDPVLPGLLEAMRARFSSPMCHAAYPDWRVNDAEGRVVTARRAPEFSIEALIGGHCCIPGPGAFFRKSCVADMMVRDPRAHGVTDFDFWIRFAVRHRGIVRVPEVLANWRAHVDGATFRLPGARLARAHVDMIERLFEDRSLPRDVARLRGQAMSAAYYNAALVGLRGAGVPSLRYALASYATRAVWSSRIPKPQRRSLIHLAYAGAQPVAGLMHEALGGLIPAKYSRSAMKDQAFGNPDYSARQRHHSNL